MFYGKLAASDTYSTFLTHPVWLEALDWLRKLPPTIEPGIYSLRGDQMFANVHGYETKPRAECRYESHQRFIDLQYCLKGGEIIEWHPTDLLLPTRAYDSEKDVVHYSAPSYSHVQLRMAPSCFCIFFPSDGHMPKARNESDRCVEKLVIKIDRTLFL